MDPIKTENSPLLRKINASFKALYFAIAVILIVLAVVLVLLVLLLAAASKDSQKNDLVNYNNCNCSAAEPLSKSPSLSPSSNYVSQKFRKSLFQLLDYITKGDAYNTGYKWLEVLADDFGHRQVGSESLERAIDFTMEKLKEDSFDNVHTEQVDHLPHWVRGEDQVYMLQPRRLKLNVLAISHSMPAEVTASVVVLKDFEEFEATNVTGKIVLFSPLWQGYGKTVAYRGAWQKVKNKGGVGLLVKSITPFSIGSAHTGSGGSGATIPTGCIPIEEAELIGRLYNRQKDIVVQMSFKSTMKEDTSSRNTVFEIKGSKWPNQIVLLSAHMDSWDVGQGAMDDGGGMAAVWQAMKCILDMSKRDSKYAPKRGQYEEYFWTAEEQGYFGSQAYYNSHSSNSNENIFFVSETDNGAFKPLNFNSSLKFAGNENQKNRIKQIVQLLNEYEIPLSVRDSTDQGDVGFWTEDKVPGVNYSSDKGANYYFYFHHSNGDYMTVFKEGDIDYTAAIFSSLAHVLANMDDWETE